MRCSICKYSPLPANARFCPNCGSQLPSPPVIDFAGYITDRAKDFTGRDWVFEAINDWLDKSDSSPVFLLTGEPGSGKTAISAHLTQFSDGQVVSNGLSRLAPGFLSAYHFCSARDRGWINPHTFAESLALQLSQRYPAYAKALAEKSGDRQITIDVTQQTGEVSGQVTGVVIRKLDVGGISAEDAFIRIVREPLETLLQEEQPDQVVILIDALDESLAYSGQVGIVSLVAEATNLPPEVRFILTSRRDERVENDFFEAAGFFLSAGEFDSRNYTDVVDYIDTRLNQDDLASKAGTLDKAQRAELASQISQRAAGNFLYVRFLLDEVATGRRDLSDLEGLPVGLDSLYYDSLDRVVKLGEAQWRSDYAPLVGVLSVAQQNLTLSQLGRFAGRDQDTLWQSLVDLGQFIEEVIPEDEGGDAESQYRLYHQSVVDFLRKRHFQRDHRRFSNKYCLSADKWHRRIVERYRGQASTWEKVDWSQVDDYGLQHLTGHLRTRLDLEEDDDKKAELAKEIYDLVLDEGFRKAQREILGDLNTTLADLSETLNLALQREDLVKILACAGAYRDTIRSQSMASAVFAAVDEDDLDTALRRAEIYSRTPDWARVLFLYLAWESALRNDEATAQEAIVRGLEQPVVVTQELCDALVAHVVRILSQHGADGRSAGAWFRKLYPTGDAQQAIQRFGLAQPITPERKNELLQQVDERLQQLRYVAADDYGPQSTVQLIILDDEERAGEMAGLRDILAEAAAHPEGLEKLAATLELILPNPYPQYRDIALDALGIAVLAADNPLWVRDCLRHILYVGLDQEGVTFTFDLASMLMADAERRGRTAPWLRTYLDRALNSDDQWGTSVRAYSAKAAALFRLGNRDKALSVLRHAAKLPTGFAGFATMTLLSLANRWLEFGRPDEASDDLNDLIQKAGTWASKVNDSGLQMRREKLVQEYQQTWLLEEIPTFEIATARLQEMPDRGTRRTYKDYVSANWSWPPGKPNLEALKALVPWTLVDGTRLDSVLGRLAGLLIHKLGTKGLPDEQLDEAIDICQRSLATGEPWRLEAVGIT